ncbi:TPA: helix-turn-helix domain-containing protein, partial [Streptococcus pyogenes]
MSHFSDRLKGLRKKNKLTQQELANNIGVNRVTLTKWEKEYIEPNLETLTVIANYFNVSTDFLLGLDKSVDSNWITSMKTSITKILDIPKDSQLQKRIEERLEYDWNKYKEKYP